MIIILTLLAILCVPLCGYFIVRNTIVNPTVIAWILAIAFNLFIYFFIDAAPLLLMFLYIAATFLSLKIVVANNQLQKEKQLNFMQWSLFCYGWFGMNPAPFKSFPAKPLADYTFCIKKGIARILFGLLLVNIVNYIFSLITTRSFDFILYLADLIGLSFILHFGILNISTGILRRLGINVGSLFKDPIKSKSLKEFWSKRWNLAFVELTTIAVLRPLKKRYGYNIAFCASYIFSGLLHEMAISLPVRAGYGKPFTYFIIQAILILVGEKYLITDRTNAVLKKCWLFAGLFLPVFLLFHHAFIVQVVLPMVNYLKFLK